MRSRKILIVDSDAALRGALVEQLQAEDEFEVKTAADAAAAIDALAAQHIDLVLVDIALPDMHGRDLCGEIRRQGSRTPIIMMAPMDAEADTILALEAGANDWVAKPLRLGILMARIKAQLRQHESSEDAVLPIGRFSFRPGAKLLIDEAGNRIRLTEKETAILKYLFRAGDRPTARELLLNEVWGYSAAVTTHTLETHIYRLRQKIEEDPSHAEILVTEAGGYRLVT